MQGKNEQSKCHAKKERIKLSSYVCKARTNSLSVTPRKNEIKLLYVSEDAILQVLQCNRDVIGLVSSSSSQ